MGYNSISGQWNLLKAIQKNENKTIYSLILKIALKIQKGPLICVRSFLYFDYLTAAFNSFPALKAGTFEAAICISSPVCGLRPVRAARSRNSDR